MSIITISKRTYDRSEEIAAKAAKIVGYECIGREVFVSASHEFEIPEAKLYDAILGVPSLLGMSPNKRKRYIAYVQASLAAYMLKDNVVYYGPAGHLLIQGVSHVLRVRIIAHLEDRIALKMEQEHVSEKEARKSILHDDEQRRKWVKMVYDKDVTDPSLYDLVINIGQITVDQAADIIAGTVKSKKFQPMTYSINLMKSIELSHRVRAHLIDIDPDIRVRSENGNVHVYTKASGRAKKKNIESITERANKLSGVKSVEVHMSEDLFQRIAGEMR
jgi:cytidylate kinase